MGCPADQTLFPSRLPPGPRNAITDVAGVTVGHCTLARGDLQTGVTAVLPHGGNLFREKVPAGCAVFNGFGKTMGLMQLAELGTLETPIVLTNTLSAGTAYTALVRRALEENPSIGVTTGTVNPLVCECNDGQLNDIRSLPITEDHVFQALAAAAPVFAEGAVGAGRGMVCYGCKGGVGTASRLAELPGQAFTVGALVLSNYGRAGDLAYRFLPQAYNIEEYYKIQQLGFEDIILTLYKIPTDVESLVPFAAQEKPWAITIPAERFYDELLIPLAATGVSIYAHSVNSVDFVDAWSGKGLTGIYTDYFTPNRWLYGENGGVPEPVEIEKDRN